MLSLWVVIQSHYILWILSQSSPPFSTNFNISFWPFKSKNFSFVIIFGQNFFRIRRKCLFMEIWSFFRNIFCYFSSFATMQQHWLGTRVKCVKNLCVFDILVLHCWIERKVAGFIYSFAKSISAPLSLKTEQPR